MDDKTPPEKAAQNPTTITAIFQQIEHGISVVIGAILIFATLLVLSSTLAQMGAAIKEWPASDRVFDMVDKLLFVLMLVEILHTVRASITSMHLAVEPFLIVGLIATVRRILVVTLQTSGMATDDHPVPPFDHSMIELAVLAMLTLVLISSIYISRKSKLITNEAVEEP